QGIGGIGNPLGQRLAPASLVIRVRQTEFMRRRPDSRESAGPGDFAGALNVAAVQHVDQPGTVTDDTVNQLRWIPDGSVATVNAGEIGLQTVVFLLRDGIELVSVAASAVGGEAHER